MQNHPNSPQKALKRIVSKLIQPKSSIFLAFFSLWMGFQLQIALAQQEFWTYRGYVKELGALSFTNNIDQFRFDNIVHSRLENSFRLSESIRIQGDIRLRLFNGYTVQNFPGYADILASDPGFQDLSTNLIASDKTILNLQSDRLHIGFERGNWSATAGRQRLNWGKTMVWNPNDLFNAYAYLDFDYEERPGTDAIHLAYSWSYASSLEIAYKAVRSHDESVFAAMYRGSLGTYDVQFLSGRYRRHWMGGAGWSGYLGTAGFKGEISVFIPDSDRDPFATASIGTDYMFSNGIFTTVELLYNGGHQGGGSSLAGLSAPPSATDLFVTESAGFISLAKTMNPLLVLQLGYLGGISDPLHIFIPQLTYSLAQNLDLLILAQISGGRIIKSYTPHTNAVYIRVKWVF
jgi:hypothetical protein